MIPLHRLQVRNFKSLQDVDVSLRALNVLVGPNGAGKSNLREVIQFLGDIARLDLGPAIAAHGGMTSLLSRAAKRISSGRGRVRVKVKPRIELSVQAQVTKHSSLNALDEYNLGFWTLNQAYVRRERFTFKRYRGRGRRITVEGRKFEVDDDKGPARKRSLDAGSAALATLPRLGESEGGEQVKQLAELFMTFRAFDANVDAARRPSRVSKDAQLAPDASNLAEFLTYLAAQHTDTFELLEDDLRYILPGLERLHFDEIGGPAAFIALSLEERGLKGTTPLADASFGTVRALALLAMLHDPDAPLLTCVEEIDHGLHPYALDRIVERLRGASRRTQILVATHSPAFVNRLTADELIVCERDPDTGASRIPAIDPELVAEMAEASELRLGELWFSGSLGGVP